MPGKSALVAGAAIGLILTWGAAAAAAPAHHRRHHAPPRPSALERKLETLSGTVQALDARLNEETRARQAMEAQLQAARADAAASQAEAQAARAELSAQVKTIPGVVSHAITDETSHGFPFQGLRIIPGGFLAAESIYRSRNEASDISSSFSRIPFDNSPIAHTDEFRFTARQTRFSLLIQSDINRDLQAVFYGEFDFQAAAQTANSIESNSYNPRIRHLYGTLDWRSQGVELLAGQNWSLATLNSKGITPRNEVPPPSIDGQYIPGFVWARQPQVRLTKNWNNTFWAAVSLENPQTTFAAPATGIASTATGVLVTSVTPGISGFDANNNLSLNHVPDIIAKLAWEPSIGGKRPLHVEAFGLWRSYSVRVNLAPGNALGLPARIYNDNADGGGVGGSITYSLIPGHLDLQGSILSGSGIGRYGSSQLPDVTFKPDGRIAPIHETMFLVGGTWHVTPALDLYVFGGEERQKAKFYDTATGFFGFGNPAATFTAASCTTEGGICVPNIRRVEQITSGLWYKPFTGSFGQIRVGLQYSHTKLTGFRGVGGFEPTTDDDMVFTSFRYYLPSPAP
jgi:hypothetical protein